MLSITVGDAREDARLPLCRWDKARGAHCERHNDANGGKES